MNLCEIIRAKKGLREIDLSLVQELVEQYIKKHNLQIERLSPVEQKVIVRDIRKELRLYTGRFHASSKEKKLQKALEAKEYSFLLAHHTSTAERAQIYPQLQLLYTQLKPKRILDIGSGINPLAFAQKGQEYFAYDINGTDLEYVRQFARQENKHYLHSERYSYNR
jgi:ribosomal protein RSM22 (predicted rRNA methylase)